MADARQRALALVLLMVGCGLRNDPTDLFETGDLLLRDAGPEGRQGSCTDPISIKLEEAVIRGYVHGGGLYTHCGDDEGPEQVFTFTPAFSTTATFRFIPDDTDFTPTLRITSNGCAPGEGDVRVCDVLFEGEAIATSLQRAVVYTLTVDSPRGTAGDYALEVHLGT